MIPFNKPFYTGKEEHYIQQVVKEGRFAAGGIFNRKCRSFLQELTHAREVLLTPSCTAALELAALICEIKEGDEVIMSSFTFTSTATSFALRGAKIVFVDIDPQTMNIDAEEVSKAVNSRTKAIVVMHYAAVACNMEYIQSIATKHNLWIIEDAAQCIDSYYQEKHLGTFGHLGAFSFHDTKNIHCGEGGALLINDESLVERAHIIWDKGTNRKQFLEGKIDKYSWIDIGSSYVLSEINAAFLFAQLEEVKKVSKQRLELWNSYKKTLTPLEHKGCIKLPCYSDTYRHNSHIFYIKCRSGNERSELIAFLGKKGINAYFHYVPLHNSIAGKKFGLSYSQNKKVETESKRLLRLPLFMGMEREEIDTVCEEISNFYLKGWIA